MLKPKSNTSLAAKGALAHRLQRRTACNTSPPAESKMADRVWKPQIIGPSDQLSLNKFFDLIIGKMALPLSMVRIFKLLRLEKKRRNIVVKL